LSLRKRRDEQDFRNTQGLIKEFVEWEKDGRCELYFFDESGFSQSSSLPYAWSPIGERVEIPGYSHSKRLNVLGFLSQQGPLYYQATTERVTSDIVIEAFEGFIKQKDPESFVVIFLDNAPMHRSKKFKKMCYEWVNQRVYIIFLSAYSPELNSIELLWKKIKYEWLPISANLSFKDLCQSVNDILADYGEKYRINFG